MNVVFCSSEVVPYAKTGGLADVCGTLPAALKKMGLNVCIILPFYQNIDPAMFKVQKLRDGLAMTLTDDGIPVYFIENDQLYGRPGIYGDSKGDYPDNLERFQFFCWNALAVLKEKKFSADIVHCHDWQTGLIPAYLKHKFQNDTFFKKMKSILTIHNLAYQGLFEKENFGKLNLDSNLFQSSGFEFYQQINFLKGGILLSDDVTTVSPQYAKEIQTQEFGCGLEGVLRLKGNRIKGILNGLDYDYWNPQADPMISKNFNSNHLQGKEENKRRILEEFHLPYQPNVPLLGFVGRLSYQKGIDLICSAIEELGSLNCQMIFLGVGDEKYHKILQNAAKRYPQKVSIQLNYDEDLAHRVYAGSDFFLMPSRYEPCGLSQMISLRYGTIPIVFKTGGLADTIQAFSLEDGTGNGFLFNEYSPKAFAESINEAMTVFQIKPAFTRLIENAMACRFSWENSAKEYIRAYENCMSAN